MYRGRDLEIVTQVNRNRFVNVHSENNIAEAKLFKLELYVFSVGTCYDIRYVSVSTLSYTLGYRRRNAFGCFFHIHTSQC